jgi:hypothetical protein
VGVALMDGPTEASRKTGVPEATIRSWMDRPEFAELRARTKEAVAEEWWAGVQLAFRRSLELLASTDDAVKAATAGAIIFDKLALSRGEVTSRTENRTWTDGLDPDKQRRLRDWALDKLDELGPDVPDGAATGTGVREPTTG